jgi:Outer membrane protein beta-barrel domain
MKTSKFQTLIRFSSAAAFAAGSFGIGMQSAYAQACPPGGWFCEQAAPAPAPAAPPAAQAPLAPLPPPPAGGAQVQTNGGVVVNQQAGSGGVTIVQGGAAPAPAAAPAAGTAAPIEPPAPPSGTPVPVGPYVVRNAENGLPSREWGINLNLQGVGFGGGSGMAGLGAGLRYKPSRQFGIEGSLAIYGGADYYGRARAEAAAMVNGLVFLNPQSRTQFYLLGGLGLSAASISQGFDELYYSGGYNYNRGYRGRSTSSSFSYFGGQLGVGIEFRLGRHVALNFDVRAFVRTRTDARSQGDYEFVSPSGQATNVSGGALSTAGLTIYF